MIPFLSIINIFLSLSDKMYLTNAQPAPISTIVTNRRIPLILKCNKQVTEDWWHETSWSLSYLNQVSPRHFSLVVSTEHMQILMKICLNHKMFTKTKHSINFRKETDITITHILYITIKRLCQNIWWELNIKKCTKL